MVATSSWSGRVLRDVDSGSFFPPPTIMARLTFQNPRYNRMLYHPILLIDDDESLTALLQDSLRREGYDPKSCVDIAHAEEELKRQSFDVILLDVISRTGVALSFARNCATGESRSRS
jgi:PleD family two-component response regulator